MSGLPHVNQSAYRKAVSCLDAIFATHEVVAKHLRGGSCVYMCLYDLQKALDSVEYLVLLEKLFDVGVNGKMWTLLKSWYDGGSCKARMGEMLSENYQVARGVKQGVDAVPSTLSFGYGPSFQAVAGIWCGFDNQHILVRKFPSDNVRTLATNEESLQCQVALLRVFAEENLLKLNISKYEIVPFLSQKGIALPFCEVERSVMPAGNVGKCLGYLWRGDLSASTSIDENI